ncbi:calmodulin-4-like [Protopterus annectens]|uniref:calmodulin-4-like n=1 Tax=Protopterus annectens TaxID=7888 RepID=UPI001CFA6F42|nr:calmodulin-4-like [Protopterus annectens]
MATTCGMDIGKLRTAFDKIDKDKSGKVTCEELQQVFKESGLTISKERIQDFVQSLDTDKDGKICFEEFCTLFKQQKK